jgi:hypothetical protein
MAGRHKLRRGRIKERRHDNSSSKIRRRDPTLRRRGQRTRISIHRTRPARRLICGNRSFLAARRQITTAADGRLMGDRVAAVLEATVLPIADPTVGAVLEAEAVVALEEAVVGHAEAAVGLRMRLRHTVAAESLTGKVEGFSPSLALPFTDCGFVAQGTIGS